MEKNKTEKENREFCVGVSRVMKEGDLWGDIKELSKQAMDLDIWVKDEGHSRHVQRPGAERVPVLEEKHKEARVPGEEWAGIISEVFREHRGRGSGSAYRISL